jgi:hypothetical protein
MQGKASPCRSAIRRQAALFLSKTIRRNCGNLNVAERAGTAQGFRRHDRSAGPTNAATVGRGGASKIDPTQTFVASRDRVGPYLKAARQLWSAKRVKADAFLLADVAHLAHREDQSPYRFTDLRSLRRPKARDAPQGENQMRGGLRPETGTFNALGWFREGKDRDDTSVEDQRGDDDADCVPASLAGTCIAQEAIPSAIKATATKRETAISVTLSSDPGRDYRRLQSLRGWSDGEAEMIGSVRA